MDRDEARKAAEVMLAYADGKEVELYDSVTKKWKECDNPQFIWCHNSSYRIKPTPTYRPFANTEECWEEMKKHEPFGWVKGKDDGVNEGIYFSITFMGDCVGHDIEINGRNGYYLKFEEVMAFYTFADGSVFGKLTDE